jgi:hypothetical protein
MGKALKSVKGFNAGMGLLAGAAGGLAVSLAEGLGRELKNIVTSFYAAAKSASQYGDALDKASQKTGISVRTLSLLKATAEANDATFEDVTKSLQFLNKGISELGIDAEKGGKGLRALGFSAEDFKKVGNDVNKLLPEIIKRFAAMPAGPDKTKVALNLLGKSGANLIPTLNELGKNGEELTRKFEELGLIVGAKFVEKSKALDDALDDNAAAINGLKLAIGNELMPVVTTIVQGFTDWIRENKELITIKVREFAEGLAVTVDNLGSFMKILWGETDTATGSLSNLQTTVVILNRAMAATINLIGFAVKGWIEYMKVARNLAAFIPESFGGATAEQIEVMDQKIAESEKTLKRLEKTYNDIQGATDQYVASIENANPAIDEINRAFEEFEAQARASGGAAGAAGADMREFGGAAKKTKDDVDKLAEAMKKYGEQTLESLEDTFRALKLEVEGYHLSGKALDDHRLKVIASNIEWSKLPEEVAPKVIEALQRIRGVMSELTFKEKVTEMVKFVDEIGEGIADSLEKGTDKGKKELDSLEEYIGSIAANISKTVADMLTAAFTGNFNNIKRSWKDMLKNLFNSFLQFVAAIITNPIRIALEGVASGEGGGGGGGGGKGIGGGIVDIGKSIGSFFGKGFSAFKNLFSGAFWAEESFSGIITGISTAIGWVGAIVGGVLAIVNIVMSFLKKTPRLDIDFDSIKTEFGRRAALVSEILNPEFFKEQIAQISVKRGGVGLGAGGDEGIKKVIHGVLKATIESIQAVIFKLPSEIAAQLNTALLSAEIDITTTIAGERFLEFDAKGKKIAEKFKAFIEGELSAKFIMSIHDFFESAYVALGVLPDKARMMREEQMAAYKAAGSREARAEIGKEALAQFNAFVDAFNFTMGRFGDSAMEAVDQITALSNQLGFVGIPTFEEMRVKVKELLEQAEIDPETIEKYKTLRQAIGDLALSLTSSITSIIQKIEDLNTKIVALGGAAHSTAAALNQNIAALINLVEGGGLSFSQRMAALDQIGVALDMKYQKLLDQQSARFAKQTARVQSEIDAKQRQLSKITEEINAKIAGYEAAIDMAERFKSVAEEARDSLIRMFTGTNSVLTSFEKLNFIQGEIARAQQALSAAATPEAKLEAIQGLQDLQSQLIDLGAEAFGTASPEFQALFRQVADELQRIADMASKEGAKAETLQDKVDRLRETLATKTENLQASIEKSQLRLATLSEKQVKLQGEAAEKLRLQYEWLRNEYEKALAEQQAALDKLGVDTAVLAPMEAIAAEQLTVQRNHRNISRQILETLQNLQGLQHGTNGFRDFGSGTLAVLHGKEEVRTKSQGGRSEITAKIELSGSASERTQRYFAGEMARQLNNHLREWATVGEGGVILERRR